jgi:glycosyltransferase involved in cell wall biosynthesis
MKPDTEPGRSPGTPAGLVSVIVPAWNAAGTIDATLRSVRAQTYSPLEIVVVDDGSTDGTASVVEALGADDPRILLIRQTNQGVAAARNAGIAEAKGEFVAPVDADDLWHPDKIRVQVEAMRMAGAKAGLCCTGVHAIDADARIVGTYVPDPGPSALASLCRVNLVGNGSSALMPRALVVACGGYDPSLRAAGAQGCEDWQLYLRIVESHAFIVVPACLTGYRQHPAQMSGRLEDMVRSAELVLAAFEKRRPDLASDLTQGLRGMRERAAGAALAQGHYRRALQLVHANGAAARLDVAVRSLRNAVGHQMRRRLPAGEPPAPGPQFGAA